MAQFINDDEMFEDANKYYNNKFEDEMYKYENEHDQIELYYNEVYRQLTSNILVTTVYKDKHMYNIFHFN